MVYNFMVPVFLRSERSLIFQIVCSAFVCIVTLQEGFRIGLFIIIYYYSILVLYIYFKKGWVPTSADVHSKFRQGRYR